jgi:hypothetical protein
MKNDFLRQPEKQILQESHLKKHAKLIEQRYQ